MLFSTILLNAYFIFQANVVCSLNLIVYFWKCKKKKWLLKASLCAVAENSLRSLKNRIEHSSCK